MAGWCDVLTCCYCPAVLLSQVNSHTRDHIKAALAELLADDDMVLLAEDELAELLPIRQQPQALAECRGWQPACTPANSEYQTSELTAGSQFRSAEATHINPALLPAAPTTDEAELATIHQLFEDWQMAPVPTSTSPVKKPEAAGGKSVKQWGVKDWQPQDFRRQNWGIILGARSSGLADLDIDIHTGSPHYRAITSYLKAATRDLNPVWVGKDGYLRHILIRVDGRPAGTDNILKLAVKPELQSETGRGRDHLELRLGLAELSDTTVGMQSVLHGCHHSGSRLEWWLPEGDSSTPAGTLGTISYDNLLVLWQHITDQLAASTAS